MNNISNSTSTVFSQNMTNDSTSELNFNETVLSYLQQNQPEGSLNELLQEMRALSPDKAVSMHQLNTALLSANTQMRHDDAYSDYTTNTLDKLTTQLLGVNMLFNNMMYKTYAQTEAEDSTLL